MAYLGRQPVLGNFVKLDAISVVNGQAAYTMQNGSVNFTDYSTVNQFLVSLNGTIQSPGSSFSVSSSTITFSSNLSTGDVIDFIIVFGNSLSAGTPTDGTVSLAKLSATGTKDATTFLRGDNTFASAGLSGWSENGSNNDLLPANASAGIYLGVNSATTANLLDDYEEGTWTPVFEASSSNPTITYDGFTHGVYNKVGNVVFARGFIRTDSVSGGSGFLQLAGFPYNFSSQPYGATVLIQQVFSWGTAPAKTANDSNADTVNLYDSSGGDITTSSLATGSNSNQMTILAVYQI